MGRKRNWGYVNNHHLRLEKKPPDSLVRLRQLLLYPEHSDIMERAYHETTFEGVIGSIAASLGIILAGEYDGEELCEMLCTALRNRGKQNLSPDLKPAALRIDDQAKSIVIEQDFSRHMSVPSNLDAFSLFMREKGCIQCDNTALCKRAGKCLGDESRSPLTAKEIKNAIDRS